MKALLYPGRRHHLFYRLPGSRRRIPVILTVLLAFCPSLGAADFHSTVQAFSANQRNIKTFVGTGAVTIEMRSVTDNSLLKNFDSPIVIYMKYPDLFKLVISGNGSTTMVQKGNLVSQKIPGTDTVATNKVNEASDLFKKYFSYGATDMEATAQVLSQGTITEGGVQLAQFILKPTSQQPIQTSNSLGFTIDRSEMDFDGNNMLVRTILFSNGKAIVTTNYTYKKVGNVLVAETIATDTAAGSMHVTSTIHYTTLSVNVAVSDHEFELK